MNTVRHLFMCSIYFRQWRFALTKRGVAVPGSHELAATLFCSFYTAGPQRRVGANGSDGERQQSCLFDEHHHDNHIHSCYIYISNFSIYKRVYYAFHDLRIHLIIHHIRCYIWVRQTDSRLTFQYNILGFNMRKLGIIIYEWLLVRL